MYWVPLNCRALLTAPATFSGAFMSTPSRAPTISWAFEPVISSSGHQATMFAGGGVQVEHGSIDRLAVDVQPVAGSVPVT